MSSVVLWMIVALLVFWSMGAYNRLVRLRAEVNAGFALLDAALSAQADVVLAALPAPDPGEPEAAFLASLRGAAAQLQDAVLAARASPLEAERIDALDAAHEAMRSAWERAVRDDTHDLAGPLLPDAVFTRLEDLGRQRVSATERFNAAISVYNQAIGEFPALLLAMTWGFRPGRGLGPQP